MGSAWQLGFPTSSSVYSDSLSVQEGYHADLHVHILGQAFYRIGLTCGEVACEVLSIDFVDLAKERDIAQEDRRLYHVAEIHTGRGKDGFQVMHDLVCLTDDVVSRRLDIARGRIDGYLTGDIEGVTGQDGLAIGTDRGGRVGRVYDLLFHTAARYGKQLQAASFELRASSRMLLSLNLQLVA